MSPGCLFRFITNELPLVDGFENVTEGMMHNTVTERGGADLSLLGLGNITVGVFPRPIIAAFKLSDEWTSDGRSLAACCQLAGSRGAHKLAACGHD